MAVFPGEGDSAVFDDAVEGDFGVGELGEEGLAGVGETLGLGFGGAAGFELVFLIKEAEEERGEHEAGGEDGGGEPETLPGGGFHW